jgi:predicted XRE-type DNA-binding protein
MTQILLRTQISLVWIMVVIMVLVMEVVQDHSHMLCQELEQVRVVKDLIKIKASQLSMLMINLVERFWLDKLIAWMKIE